MSRGNVAYEVTAEWVADLVLKANRMLGRYSGLLDAPEARGTALAFNCEFMHAMACGGEVQHEAHDAIYCMSQLRKAVNALINEAGTPVRSTKTHLSYAAFD